jgi:hypothetical protein
MLLLGPNIRSWTSEFVNTGVSKIANQEFKRIFYLVSISGIQYQQEFKTGFKRIVPGGKPKMSVLNAARNKLWHQIIAVMKRAPFM